MEKLDVVYGRVSTEDQTSNTSLGDQEQKCIEYLTRLGLTNIVVYKEDYSGFEFSRPELNKILDLMRQGKVRSFTSLRVDRISRKVGVLERLREQFFIPLEIKVHTLDLFEWNWSTAHVAMQDQLCALGAYWGKILVEVLANGRKKSVMNGNVLTAGHAVLGLEEVPEENAKGKRTGSHIEFSEIESPIVLKIFYSYVKDDMSITKIAKMLNETGTPTYTQLRDFNSFEWYQKKQSKTGHKWRNATVRQVLRETAYDGRWYYGKSKVQVTFLDNGDKVKKRVKNTENLIEVKIPALIPHDIWLEAQKKLDENREKRGKEPRYKYLFSKRIRCKCGMAMTAYPRYAGKYLYYRCPLHKEDKSCDIKNLNSKLVDNVAWNWFYGIASNKGELKRRILRYQDEYDKALAEIREKMDFINKSLEKKNTTHEAMLKSLFQLPELARGKTLAMIGTAEEEIKELQAEKEELFKKLDDMEIVLDLLGAYLGVFGDPETVLGDNFNPEILEEDTPDTFEKRLQYVKDFDIKVVVLSKEEIKVSCRIGSEVLSLLNVTSYDSIQKGQKFYLDFSDILRLDLKQFQAA